MECPSCQASNSEGQKFCGTCGQKLEATCARCQAENPPHYKFCGSCGADLKASGTIALARSGLITQTSQQALNLLGYRQEELQGKPFSLFVAKTDLVVFFSHMNDLVNHARPQSFDITLNHKTKEPISIKIELRFDGPQAGNAETIHVFLTETTNGRFAAEQVQAQEELLGLMFTVTHNISTVSDRHAEHSFTDALKKICLFAKADACFIHRINRQLKRLEPAYGWNRSENAERPRIMRLSQIKHAVLRLRNEKLVVIDDVATLTPAERKELQQWQETALGAIIWYMIYSRGTPVGVIGVAKADTTEKWRRESKALVRFFGDFIAERLALAARHDGATAIGPQAPADAATSTGSSDSVIRMDERRARAGSPVSPPADDTMDSMRRPVLSDLSRPMLLEKAPGGRADDHQSVYPRDDGLVLLTCDACGIQESVSVGQFEKLGNAVRVNCPCGTLFTAVLEKRRFYRKSVSLEGYFALGDDLGPVPASGSIWGPMVVRDLSKAGLRFTSEKAKLVHEGDLLVVRFNLDNTNQALIHKSARVVSVIGEYVGCQFEGADNYDVTLGFYFV
ncbi:MAG: hypothetical protein HKP58_18735 [Desulfatitalea sp.]|nr:zinc ribbon domain-containing protein [Desulfatitalea sp.]NNK02453.1 hypothetical protein [Desulfatitalea sp.]